MTRDFAVDPEVAADLDRQARSERDRTRTRGDGIYDWTPAPIVESWPCRGCDAQVGMTRDAINRAIEANQYLVKRGEKSLSKREATCCPTCRQAEVAADVERERRRGESIQALTRELRAGVFPWRETQIAAELAELGANANELIKCVANERKATASTAKRSSSL